MIEEQNRCTLQAYQPNRFKWNTSPYFNQALPQLPELLATQNALFDDVLAAYEPNCHERLEQLKGVFIFSPWLCDVFKKHNQAMINILMDKDHIESVDYASLVEKTLPLNLSEDAFMSNIRALRNQHMARIALRDLLGLADVQDTLADLSDLAHAFVQHAYVYARQSMVAAHGEPRDRDGNPVDAVVLGMGKLGGKELNFSSDIDLMFFYSNQGMSDGERCLDNGQFFIRLGQKLIKLLDARTADGFVYRVDMRLRPFGDSGALAMSFDAAEKYYQDQGREWERYAMIKACALYGQEQDIDELRSRINPFVYRKYLDFSAIESLRDLKQKIAAQVHQKGAENNIKLGQGGIREIEFIAQAFQIIYGGKRIELQQRSLVDVLSFMAEQAILPKEVVSDLLEAYAFLRLAENRLQIMRDAQTHILPGGDEDQARLAYSMGFNDWPEFINVLDKHRNCVAAQFDDVFKEEETKQSHWESRWRQQLPDGGGSDDAQEIIQELLVDLGIEVHQLSHCTRIVHQITHSSAYAHASDEAQTRLNTFMPVLFERLSVFNGDKVSALHNVLALVRAVTRRSNYLVLLYENQSALDRLLDLFSKSAWIAEQITAQPILLDSLLDERQLFQLRDQATMEQELDVLTASDQEEVILHALREFKNATVLSIAAIDVSGKMPLMKVSDHLTQCAEVLVQFAHQWAHALMVERHGVPLCMHEGERIQPSMGVIGYGKVGGLELGYSSDLDLVFIHDGKKEKAYTQGREDGKGVIDNTLFFTRLAQRFSSILQTNTVGGQVYEVDTRLRPDGNSGQWVKSLEGFENYQLHDAWTWEHQALVRARFISGSDELKQQFEAIRARVLGQKRNRDELRVEVAEMREKIRASIRKEAGNYPESALNLKKDRGGLTDIEFIVQYTVLAYAHDYPELLKWTDNIRILEVAGEAGVMNREDCHILIESYRQIRARIHGLALNKQKAWVTELGDLAPTVQAVSDCWHRYMIQ